MEKAKAAISDFISKDGKHRTSVDQDHSKAITEEHVRPHAHEEVTTAVDREVHKDHHYTTIQPVTHKETLPEQHHHNIIPVEHKTVDHGGHSDMTKALEREAAQFHDTTTTHNTTHTEAVAPVVSGEHVHHHVHEHVQPVIHKETLQPHVVHTTIPVHETHHVAPVHHGTKVAPTKTLEEFTSVGGLMEGRSTKALHEYDGCPQTQSTTGKTGLGTSDSTHTHTHGTGAKAAGAAALGAGAAGAAHHHHKSHDNDVTDSSTTNTKSRGPDAAVLGAAAAAGGAGIANHKKHSNTTGTRDNTLGASGAAGGQDPTGFESSSNTKKEDISRLADTLGTKNSRDTSSTYTDSEQTSGSNQHGSMFGKDKVRLSDLYHTVDHTDSSKPESRSYLQKDRKGVTETDVSSDNYNTAGGVNNKVNKEGAFGGPAAVPRSENTATTDNTTSGTEPWHAGGTHQIGTERKVSLVDKINPFKDADGDGKKGFMK
jgi:hypothetical protein